MQSKKTPKILCCVCGEYHSMIQNGEQREGDEISDEDSLQALKEAEYGIQDRPTIKVRKHLSGTNRTFLDYP